MLASSQAVYPTSTHGPIADAEMLFACLIMRLGVSDAHDNMVVRQFSSKLNLDPAWVLKQLEMRLAILSDRLH
jgi:hypothetical protein